MPATAAPTTVTIPSSYRLAKLTGFHRAHVHRVLYLNGGASLDFAIRLARAAGISLDELVAHIYGDYYRHVLRAIDDRRAEWLSEEAKKRRSIAANNGNGSGKRRRK